MRINISYDSGIFVNQMNGVFVIFDSFSRIKDICTLIIGLIPFRDIY